MALFLLKYAPEGVWTGANLRKAPNTRTQHLLFKPPADGGKGAAPCYCPTDSWQDLFYEKEGTENGFAILSGVTVVTVTL